MTGDAPSMAFEPRQTSTWGGANISATALMKKLEYWLESERDNIPLWIPVGLGTGIAAWFSLSGPFAWMAWISASLAIAARSEEHTSELQSLMRISYAVFCLKQKTQPSLKEQYKLLNAIKES